MNKFLEWRIEVVRMNVTVEPDNKFPWQHLVIDHVVGYKHNHDVRQISAMVKIRNHATKIVNGKPQLMTCVQLVSYKQKNYNGILGRC